MLTGLLFIILAGFIAMAIGCVVSTVSARGYSFDLVQGLSYLLLMTGCILAALFRPRTDVSARAMIAVALLASLSGICSYLSYSMTARAMTRGPGGLIWGCVQAGLAGSFLMGIIAFGEKASWERVSGISLILAGVMCISVSRDNGGGKYSPSWKWWTLAAFLMAVLSQITCALPSFVPEASACGILHRTLFSCVGSGLIFWSCSFPKIHPKNVLFARAVWVFAVLLVLLFILNSVFLLGGLDLLAAHRMGSIGLPVAGGVSIASFAAYSIIFRHERPGRLGLTGLAALLAGCGLIAL